jgi:hypothetical protein
MSNNDLTQTFIQTTLKRFALPNIGRFSNIYIVAVAIHGQTNIKMSF